MKSILVPTDFSECSKNAIVYALNLAKDFYCDVTLLNAFHVPSAGGSTAIWGLEEELRNDSNKQLQILKDDLIVKFKNINITIISSYGLMVNEIGDELKRKKYDLIVIGTKGASGIKEVFIGSNTAILIDRVKVPIMAIPDGVGYVKPKTFTLASDLKQIKNRGNLKFIAELASKYIANIKVLKVHWDGMEMGLDESIETFKELHDIKKKVDGVELEFLEIEAFDTENAILENTRDPQNILTVIHRNRKFLSRIFHTSLTKKLAMHAKSPLIILQDK